MGQRLVTAIHTGENTSEFMQIYMHWSAYSVQAYFEIKRIYEAIGEAKTEKDIIAGLANIGIYPIKEEIAMVSEKYGIKIPEDGLNRNEGIYSITEKGMAELLAWAEGNASINLETGDCTNDCFFFYEDKEYWFEEYQDLLEVDSIDDVTLEECPVSPSLFNIDDIDTLIEWVENADKLPFAFTYDGEIHALIS